MDTFRNKTRYAILGFLMEEPKSGYDINKGFKDAIQFLWDIKKSQIYPELRRMKNDGLVTMEIEQNENGPSRKVYSVTDKGRQAFLQWMNHEEDWIRLRFEILLKIFFGNAGSGPLILEKLRYFNEKHQQLEDYVNEIGERIKSEFDTDSQKVYPYLPILFGIRFSEMAKNWTREASELIEQYGLVK